MTKKLFSILSYIFHPVFMPILGIYLILYSGTYLAILPAESKRAILLMTAMFTVLLPLSVLPFLRYYKLISKYTIPERRERLIPLFLSVVFYGFGLYLFRKYGIPFFIQQFLLVAIICLLIAVLVHFWWKISTHMMGIGGILGLISSFNYLFSIDITFVLILTIIVAGVIGTARLYLKSHNQAQVYSGFMVGFIISFAIMALLNF